MSENTEKDNTPSSSTNDHAATEKPVECIATEEYAAVPEGIFTKPTLPTFHQRKYDIYQRLRVLVVECRRRYSGRKELASEDDQCVADLCETLYVAFQYGLKQEEPKFVLSAASLFQNMHEIVTGSSSTSKPNFATPTTFFWDFCRNFLTHHERQRFEQLKHTSTTWGKGRSFLRASLNEHSLQRYILTWLSEKQTICSYYSHWSLLTDEKIAPSLPELIKSLDDVLFALTVDKTELNAALKMSECNSVVVKEEPVILAPIPIMVKSKNNRKQITVERPIVTSNSTEDLLKHLQGNAHQGAGDAKREQELFVDEEISTPLADTPPPDPIEPELEFPKEPLSFFEGSSISSANSISEPDYNDVKSDTSSQGSKTSIYKFALSGGCENSQHIMLEQQLKEVNERCSLLETRVAQLSLENRQLIRRLKQHFEDSGIDPSSSFATNFLITIPHVKLQKSKLGTASYHLYEIHITMRQNLEHWSLWRRYNDFNKLHKTLLKTHPAVSAVEFPPKKHIGNMNQRFVEERRQQLQIYLLNLVETLPQLETCKSKIELQKVFPFLRER